MEIILKSGESINTSSLGLRELRHYIPSLGIEHTTTNLEGRGSYILDSYYTNRTITVEFLLERNTLQEYFEARDLINAILMRNDEFYIVFDKEPNKRWLVKNMDNFRLEPNKIMSQFSVNFITVNKFAESVNNTVQNESGLSFSVNYGGNAILDPRENDLMVEFVVASNNEFTITNTTNGSRLIVRDMLTLNDTCLLNNIRFTINDVPRYSRTNGGLIVLSPGVNNFTAVGGTLQSIRFTYRELYK